MSQSSKLLREISTLLFSYLRVASYPRIGLSAQGNMSAITEGPVSFVEFNEESSDGPEVAILFVGVSLLLGIASRQLLCGTKAPYIVSLLLLGISLGSLGYSWGYLVLLYVFLQLSRVIVIGVLYPGLRYFGYGLDWKEAIMLVWSGLRGAVALALSLSVNMRILDYTRYEMNNKALEAFGELGEDEELGPADWPSVVKYITCLRTLQEGGKTHPHDVSVNENELHKLHMQDTRLRLLNGVQAAYWGMLDEGRITQTAAILLMQSVDEALDMLVSHEALLDWKGLEAHVRFPSYFKYLQMRFLPHKLVTFFTVGRLELACYICAAFLRAHRIAQRQLREFIGESEVADVVIQESEAEGEAAKQFLEDVRLTFPQVLRVVKTKQVTYSVLLHLSEYVQNLEKAGLLEAKEMNQLHDAVQADLKKLLRNPPLVKMPSVGEILSSQPLLGALPSIIRDPLGNSAKEMMKMRGSLLYKEGSKPDGIWLIANGVVKGAGRQVYHTKEHGSMQIRVPGSLYLILVQFVMRAIFAELQDHFCPIAYEFQAGLAMSMKALCPGPKNSILQSNPQTRRP